jgi:putative ATPase
LCLRLVAPSKAACEQNGVVDLFSEPEPERPVPLAERLRPKRLEEVLGQPQLLGPKGALSAMLAAGRLPSLILWGPPGTGKTTIARLLAQAIGYRFVGVSAVMTTTADLKTIFAAARLDPRPTLLFVDEIHRFNRSQQDSFLAPMEEGTIVLVGATTENPSFELNAAVLSRATVLVLKRLDEAALAQLLERAESAAGRALPIDAQARAALVAGADGDGRFLLGQAETLLALDVPAPLDPAGMAAVLQRRVPVYDKDRDGHYDLISALHKAMRGSDPDAALYWLARMLVAGEAPHYVLRRIVRFASEDIGLADSNALVIALAAKQAYDFLGSPEGELAIAQACLYCAAAPKSNAAYVAQKAAWKAAQASGSLPPPRHILNAPTQLMKELGHGAGYAYDHDAPDGFSGADYWPEGMARQRLYQPTDRGRERAISERLSQWEALREARRG